MTPQRETLAVAVSCTKCRGSRVVATTAALVAGLLARTKGDGDVVHLAAAYIHCGEPMSPADPELGNAHRPVSTQPGPVDVLGVYLRTRVLRCRCGFQMEIPH
jgi:hypothetical protein